MICVFFKGRRAGLVFVQFDFCYFHVNIFYILQARCKQPISKKTDTLFLHFVLAIEATIDVVFCFVIEIFCRFYRGDATMIRAFTTFD